MAIKEKENLAFVYGRKPVYNAAEVSAMLGVSIPKVNGFIRCGLLPCINVGHRVVRHEDLQEFLLKYRGYNISEPENVRKIQWEGVGQDAV